MSDLEELHARLNKAFTESTFRIENRTIEEWLAHIEQYASLIPFAKDNDAGDKDETWNDFWLKATSPNGLGEIYRNTANVDKKLPVQQTFLLALLRVLQTQKLLLNTLPARHRSLYYRDLLGLSERAPQPDRVAVGFTLSGDDEAYRLPAASMLDAGIDAGGNPLHYVTDDDYLVTAQHLEKLCWTRLSASDNKWLLCTAYDAGQNIVLPAQGTRLFGPTEHESELMSRAVLDIPLTGLSGELCLSTSSLSDAAMLTFAGQSVAPCRAGAGGNTTYILPKNLGAAGETRQLEIALPAQMSAQWPASLDLLLTNCDEIQYRAYGGHGHLSTFSYPFGVAMSVGNVFELTVPAAMSQQGGKLVILPQWCNLPDVSFAHWYTGYSTPPDDNRVLMARIQLLSHREGEVLWEDEQPLFQGEGVPQPASLYVDIPQNSALCDTTAHIVRVTYLGPDYVAQYAQQGATGENIPWVAQVSRIDTRFQTSLTVSPPASLAEAESSLYMAISGARAGETLSLYWALRDVASLGLTWHYYDGQKKWTPLAPYLQDSSDGLSVGGLWQVSLPEDIAPGGGPLADDNAYLWLKAVMATGNVEPASSAPVLLSVMANAVTATLRTDRPIDDAHFAEPLPAGSITSLVEPVAAIQGLQQPQPSYDGQPRETTTQMLHRAALRIAHRHRAITWDNMRTLLMEQYPQIYDVRFPDGSELNRIPAPVIQTLMIIPEGRSRDNEDALRPALSAGRLMKMQQWLARLTTHWSAPVLVNPTYIDVEAKYRVIFMAGVSPDYGYRQLEMLLQQKYTPWCEDRQQVAMPGNEINYYLLLATLQRSALVQRVLSLSLRCKDGTFKEQTVTAGVNEVLVLTPLRNSSQGENHA